MSEGHQRQQISKPSNFYPKLGSVNPKLWVLIPEALGLEAEAWGLEAEAWGLKAEAWGLEAEASGRYTQNTDYEIKRSVTFSERGVHFALFFVRVCSWSIFFCASVRGTGVSDTITTRSKPT